MDPFLNEHSCYVISRLRELKLGKSDIENVLEIFHNPDLDMGRVVHTYHQVLQLEDKLTPKLVCCLIYHCSCIFLTVFLKTTHVAELLDGQSFYYKKPTEIAALLVSDPNIGDDLEFEWSYNNGHIQFPWHTDRWLDLLAYFWDFVVQGYDI